MITQSPQNEYWFHVSDQSAIPLAGIVDKSIDINKLTKLFNEFTTSKDKEQYLLTAIRDDIDLIDSLRPLIGISDKRMYLELSYLFAKTPSKTSAHLNVLNDTFYNLNKHPLQYFKNLINSNNVELAEVSINLIVKYLFDRGLVEIIHTMSKLSIIEIESLIEKLILTKEVQQAEAKRRGHGAEYELAKIINLLNCEMIPAQRFLKPIGLKDPNVNRNTFAITNKVKGKTWSFDLIITRYNEPLVFVQSLIHTSDPGQYGVNKSDETVQIKNDLDKSNRIYSTKKELWGLVDGVGFCENKKDTIDKMLDKFDCFIQLKTLYKAGLQLHKLGLVNIKGIIFDDNSYSDEMKIKMFKKYGSKNIEILNDTDKITGTVVQAGLAKLII